MRLSEGLREALAREEPMLDVRRREVTSLLGGVAELLIRRRTTSAQKPLRRAMTSQVARSPWEAEFFVAHLFFAILTVDLIAIDLVAAEAFITDGRMSPSPSDEVIACNAASCSRRSVEPRHGRA